MHGKRRRIACLWMAAHILLTGCAAADVSGNSPYKEDERKTEHTETVAGEDATENKPEQETETQGIGEDDAAGLTEDPAHMREIYLAFCERHVQENTEQMEEMLVLARESVYDVLKAYDNAAMLDYQAPSTAEQVFTEGVIDEICEGNPVAKAAVEEAVECFKAGEGLGSTFGRSMNAAVEAIPETVRDNFVEMIVPGCIQNMLNLYDTLEANSNMQIKYAINKLQDGFREDTQALIVILEKDDLGAAELREAAFLISDIYDTVYELENRFQVSMGAREWWTLNAFLQGYADEYYRCGFLAEEYRKAGECGEELILDVCSLSEEELRERIEELSGYYQDPENFVTQYAWLLGMKDHLEMLRYFDYVKLQEDSQENFVAGVLSNTFGFFLTDMFAAKKVENDNTAIDVLYQYSDLSKNALRTHREGFNKLADIEIEMTALYTDLMGSRSEGIDEMRCAVCFYRNYFNGGEGPAYLFYQDRIQSCAGEMMAYRILLDNAVSGQKALLNQQYLSNSNYIADMETENMWLDRIFYGENTAEPDYSVDISAQTAAISAAYMEAVQYLCIQEMRVEDVYQDKYYVNVNGQGDYTLTCYRKRGLSSPYDMDMLQDAVIAMTLKNGSKTVMTCAYDCEGNVRSAYAENGTYAQFGYMSGEGFVQYGIVDCNLSDEGKEKWQFELSLAGADIYSDIERAAKEMFSCAE